MFSGILWENFERWLGKVEQSPIEKKDYCIIIYVWPKAAGSDFLPFWKYNLVSKIYGNMEIWKYFVLEALLLLYAGQSLKLRCAMHIM